MRIFAGTFHVTTPDDTSIVVHRDFDAPPDKVWRAMTEPEHLRRWLGDPSFPLITCEMDVRVGGSYRWVFTQPDGPATMGVPAPTTRSSGRTESSPPSSSTTSPARASTRSCSTSAPMAAPR
jgi:Activator of Hsp90 ATPase homolog 1-like protein